MSWSPLSVHVSQLHPDGSGHADCFEASLVRYLREAGKLPLDGDPLSQVDDCSQRVRGIPDQPDNPYTTLDQASTALGEYGVGYIWSDDFHAVAQAPWSICLVNGIRLKPSQYPPSWFDYEDDPAGDHFILWMPQPDLFNDPLAYYNGQTDCRYTLASIEDSFAGAYILPDTGHGEGYQPPVQTPPQPKPPAHHISTATRACALKARPDHTSVGIAHIPANGAVNVFNRRSPDGAWSYVQYRDKYGWLPTAYLG